RSLPAYPPLARRHGSAQPVDRAAYPFIERYLGAPAEHARRLADVRYPALDVVLKGRRVRELKRLGAATELPDLAGKLLNRRRRILPNVEVVIFGLRVETGRDDAIRDVLNIGEAPLLLARAHDLERIVSVEHLACEVWDHVGDTGFVLGVLSRPVGVEGATDRVADAMLFVEGPTVLFAYELREAVVSNRRWRLEDGALRRWKDARALEHHRGGGVDDLGAVLHG